MSPLTGIQRYEVEYSEGWRDLFTQIPFLAFDPDWLVAVIPPYSGAIARFLVRHKNFPMSRVSVYLDWFDKLGCVGEPYWEVYPIQGDCERCLLSETSELLDIIGRSLSEQGCGERRGER